jgi:hypothetical protein
VHGLEAALNHGLTRDLPGADRAGNAFDLECSKLAALKQAADAPPRFWIDHHATRSRERLKPCGEVWRLPSITARDPRLRLGPLASSAGFMLNAVGRYCKNSVRARRRSDVKNASA